MNLLADPAAPTGAITITLNGQPLTVPHGTSVAQALAHAGELPTAFATALNGEFLPRAARADRRLVAGDALTTFAAIVGG